MSRTHFSHKDLVAIAGGGVCGAALRWRLTSQNSVDDWFRYYPNPARGFSFPTDTLTVNIVGCLLLGALSVAIGRAGSGRRRTLLATSTGLCGSLTTFSTVAVELAERLRGSSWAIAETAVAQALWYAAASIAGGALAFWLGRRLGWRLLSRAA